MYIYICKLAYFIEFCSLKIDITNLPLVQSTLSLDKETKPLAIHQTKSYRWPSYIPRNPVHTGSFSLPPSCPIRTNYSRSFSTTSAHDFSDTTCILLSANEGKSRGSRFEAAGIPQGDSSATCTPPQAYTTRIIHLYPAANAARINNIQGGN